MEEEKKKDERFVGLINQFYVGGMAHLGKLPNPVSGKVEENLEMAKEMIEILKMLERKTKGNLNKEEESMLKSFVTNLQLNYVEEIGKKGKEEKEKEK